MKFIDIKYLANLSLVVAEQTTSEFQTKIDIIIDPWNTKQFNFNVCSCYIPKDPHFLEGKTKMNRFEQLYKAIDSMLEKQGVKAYRLIKRYFPNEDNPYTLDITLADDLVDSSEEDK